MPTGAGDTTTAHVGARSIDVATALPTVVASPVASGDITFDNHQVTVARREETEKTEEIEGEFDPKRIHIPYTLTEVTRLIFKLVECMPSRSSSGTEEDEEIEYEKCKQKETQLILLLEKLKSFPVEEVYEELLKLREIHLPEISNLYGEDMILLACIICFIEHAHAVADRNFEDLIAKVLETLDIFSPGQRFKILMEYGSEYPDDSSLIVNKPCCMLRAMTPRESMVYIKSLNKYLLLC